LQPFLHRESWEGGSRYRILAALVEREKISQQELKEMLDIKSGSLSELLAKLEKKSLIHREKNSVDKRNRDIVLTEAGRAWLRSHTDSKRQRTGQLFAEMSGEEKSQLSALLGKILKSQHQSDDLLSPESVQTTLVDKTQEINEPASIIDERNNGEAFPAFDEQKETDLNNDVQDNVIAPVDKSETATVSSRCKR
jgi:DNA-binding MarR family transcriptional regulator